MKGLPDGGRRWIRTIEGVSQQIYSLPPLATWVSYHHQPMKRRAISLNVLGLSTRHPLPATFSIEF